MKPIFISYSPKDTRYVAMIHDHLQSAGFRPWINPSPRPGQDWHPNIDEAIRAAHALLIVVTPTAMESVYVTYEWALALALSIPVVPIIFREAQLHPRLRTLERNDYTAWKEPSQFWTRFIEELEKITTAYSSQAPHLANPAVGKRSISTNEAPAPTIASRPQFDRRVMPKEHGHWLVVRRGPELNRMFPLRNRLVTLGRDEGNEITIADLEVSRYHLRLTWHDNGYVVEDLGTTNGTMVDGVRIYRPQRLSGGQVIQLGDSVLISYEIV